MTSRGEIVDVTIPDASKQKIRQAPASMLLREVLTRDGLLEILGQSAFAFPESADSKQWSQTTEVSSAIGEMARETTIEYKGKTQRNSTAAHTFVVTATAKTLEPSAKKDAPKMDDFSGSGNAWFSPDAPLVYESEFGNRMNVTRQYRDQIIVSSVSTKTKMQVVKK